MNDGKEEVTVWKAGMRRSRTLRAKDLTAGVELTDEDREILAATEMQRPRLRAECRSGERPCPWLSCRYHLFLDLDMRNGSIKLNHAEKDLDELEHTCALDIAEEGGATLETVARLLNVTKERARQIEETALLKARRKMGMTADGEPLERLRA